MKLFTISTIAWAAVAVPLFAQWPSVPGYADMNYPADNPMTKEKVELGKQLYFDKRLSADGSKSCYSCHVKEKGLTDGLPTAIGAYEAKLQFTMAGEWLLVVSGTLADGSRLTKETRVSVRAPENVAPR